MLIAVLGLMLLTAMQVAIVAMMHYGNAKPQWGRTCYWVATVLGFACVAVVVVIFDHMEANLALGLIAGLPFVCGQLYLARITRTRISVRRWAGIVCIAAGLFILAYGSKPEDVSAGAKTWMLATEDTELTLAVVSNAVSIVSLRNPGQNWNWTLDTALVPMPVLQGKPDIKWEYREGLETKTNWSSSRPGRDTVFMLASSGNWAVSR